MEPQRPALQLAKEDIFVNQIYRGIDESFLWFSFFNSFMIGSTCLSKDNHRVSFPLYIEHGNKSCLFNSKGTVFIITPSTVILSMSIFT